MSSLPQQSSVEDVCQRILCIIFQADPNVFEQGQFLPVGHLLSQLTLAEQIVYRQALTTLFQQGVIEFRDVTLPAGSPAARVAQQNQIVTLIIQGTWAPTAIRFTPAGHSYAAQLPCAQPTTPATPAQTAAGQSSSTGNSCLGAAIVIVLVIAAIVALQSGFSVQSPAPTSGPSVQPLTARPCPETVGQRIQPNMTVRVCTQTDVLHIREQPTLRARRLAQRQPGDKLLVIDGPTCPDSYVWWKVRDDANIEGWVREGGDAVDPYFICAIDAS